MNSKLYERLLAYVAGESDPAEADEVRNLLAKDGQARDLEARLRKIVGTLRSDDSESPSARVLAEAQALFRTRQSTAAPNALASLKRFIAQLVFDSRATPAVAGLRGGTQAYQLSFESELAAVDLEIAPVARAGERKILGHVSPSGTQRLQAIHLASARSGDTPAPAQLDSHGGFTLITSAGQFDLVITFDAGELVLPNVDVT